MSTTRPFILVVDDMADAADTGVMLLELWGFDAEACYTGAAALAAAQARVPAAVLLDLGMPRMSGFEFALRLWDVPGCETTPVVAITGHPGLTLRAREVGIDHYLLKPVMDMDHLQALLRRLTAETGPSRVVPTECQRIRRVRSKGRRELVLAPAEAGQPPDWFRRGGRYGRILGDPS